MSDELVGKGEHDGVDGGDGVETATRGEGEEDAGGEEEEENRGGNHVHPHFV